MIHFERSEFVCKCGCGFDTVDFELSEVLDDLRSHFDKRTTINSGNRCKEYNETVQLEANPRYVSYSSKSVHMDAKASDIVVEDTHADDVADYLEAKYPNKYGIGRYNGRTHIDVRASRARWDKR